MATYEFSFEVSADERQHVDTLLGRLRSNKTEFFLNVRNFSASQTEYGLVYTLVMDSFALRLSEATEARSRNESPPISDSEVTEIAVSCVKALGTAQELGLAVRTLDPTVVVFTAGGRAKVNIAEALIKNGEMTVAEVLFYAAFYRNANGREDLELLNEKLLDKELAAGVIREGADYKDLVEMIRRRENSGHFSECQHCHLMKPEHAPRVCARHFFCSENCLAAMRAASNTASPHCPLCTVRFPVNRPKIQMKPKVNVTICEKCGKEFALNAEEEWRLALLGAAECSETGKFCSQSCYTASRPVAKKEVSCVFCENPLPPSGTVLHCGDHGLCSSRCASAYYQSEDLNPHSLNKVPICYGCLERYLKDIGGNYADLPDVSPLAQKVAAFNAKRELRRSQTHRTVVQCTDYISPSSLKYRFFRTVCLFCAAEILVAKETSEEFVLDDAHPLLVSCDFRMHGVCSRKCLRSFLPSVDPSCPQTVRCPKCPWSLILNQNIEIALNSRNPTQECVRRTFVPDACGERCNAKFILDGCRHELCGSRMDRLLTKEGMVVCGICGFRAHFETVVENKVEIRTMEEGESIRTS